MERDFWYGKRVLITGGNGFLASNLATTLLLRGAYVVSAVRHRRPRQFDRLGQLPDAVPDIELTDLSDYVDVQKLCNRHRIDTIFHLAASAIVGDAARAPFSTFHNNILSTLNILEAARINKIPRVLIASSDKAYGDHADKDDQEPIPYKEGYALRGLDVYSASKTSVEMIAQSYAHQFRLPVILTRCCNIYGPGDLNLSRIIPRTILRMLNGRPTILYPGNAQVRREYLYVDDAVAAYCLLGEHVAKHYSRPPPAWGRQPYGWAAYNVGSYAAGKSFNPAKCANIKRARQVIDAIAQRLDRARRLGTKEIPRKDRFIEIRDQFLDSSKLLALGYRTKTSFDDGLDRTIAWFSAHERFLSWYGRPYLEE